MGNNLDEEYLKKKAWQKRYEEVMEELRRKSLETTTASLQAQQASLTKTDRKYDEEYKKFADIVNHNHRLLGSESVSTMIMQMGESLLAMNKMFTQAEILMVKFVLLKISEIVNYQGLLSVAAQAARWTRLALDQKLNWEGHFEKFPPAFVPYLAEIDDKGVLKLDFNVPNDQMTAEGKAEFLAAFNRDLNTAILEPIRTLRDGSGQLMYDIERTADGPKIRVLATNEYMTTEEFKILRDVSLEPHLKRAFDVDFKHDAPAPRNEGGTSPSLGT